jgi:hypothetical protein
MTESDFSSDDDDDEQHRDEHGRKRVAVIDCLLESSSPSSPEDNTDGKRSIEFLNRCSDLRRLGETTLQSTRVSANEDDYVHLSMGPLSLSSAPRSTKSVKPPIVETRQLDYISMDDILRVCSMCHSSCRCHRCVRQGMLCSHIRSVFANCYARAHGRSIGPFTRAEQSGEETDSSADECIGTIRYAKQ